MQQPDPTVSWPTRTMPAHTTPSFVSWREKEAIRKRAHNCMIPSAWNSRKTNLVSNGREQISGSRRRKASGWPQRVLGNFLGGWKQSISWLWLHNHICNTLLYFVSLHTHLSYSYQAVCLMQVILLWIRYITIKLTLRKAASFGRRKLGLFDCPGQCSQGSWKNPALGKYHSPDLFFESGGASGSVMSDSLRFHGL